MSTNIQLRPAQFADANILLEWRNDELTVQYSLSKDLVSHQEHAQWMYEVLNNENKLMFIAESNSIPVGTVRAFFNDEAWMVSWTVAPEARGRGVGKKIVALLLDHIGGPVHADVKSDNIASIKIAENVGFILDGVTKGINHYVIKYNPIKK